MFQATIKDSDGFKSILSNLTDIAEFFQLQYSTQGMTFSILDRGHTVFIQGTIKDTAFTEIQGQEGSVTLSTDDIQSALQNIKQDIQIIIKNNQVTISGTNQTTRQKYQFPEYSEDIESADLPDFPVEEEAKVSMDFLKTAIKNSDRMSSSVFFHTTSDMVQATAENMWQFTSKLQIPGKFTTRQQVALDGAKLQMFTRFGKINNEIILGLSSDRPLKIIIRNDDVELCGLVAPRLEEA